MTTKKFAISKPSEAIALKYGKNVSQGIKAMKEKIDELTHAIKDAIILDIGE